MTPHLMKKIAFVPLIAAVGGLLYLPFSGGNDLGQMEIQAITGRVEVVRAGETIEVDGKMPLKVGDLIRTAGDGAGRLRLTGKRSAWVAASSSVLVSGIRSLASRSGSLLVRSEDAITVAFGDVKASSSRGIFRVDQGFGSVHAASYGGDWRLAAPGQAPLRLPYLFQAAITAGRLPRATEPYRLAAKGDLWEDEFLGDVLQLDQDLTSLAAALSTQLGSSRPGLTYFSSLAGRDVGFMRRYLKRPTAALLIGFTVAQTSRRQSLATGLERAFQLADEGASWGVVAKILRARETTLVAQLDRLIIGTGIIADGGASQPVFALTAPLDDSGDVGSAVPTQGTGDQDTTSTEDPTKDPGVQPTPGTDPDPNGGNDHSGEPSDCESEADCAAQDVIDQLPHASPSPSSSELPLVAPGG